MNKSMTRTLVFVITAVVSTALAVTSNQFTKPTKIEGGDDFAKDFNPDFTDAGKATAMQVVSFDEATAAPKRFAVQYDGGWKIPSYHGYPADGKDQLAKAAASVIGLKRGSLASRRKTDHERYGVIDPLDEENPATKGRGTRITISHKETALADFIVGNKVEGSEDKRYVRKKDEDKVYIVGARFDVSTKFSDWAETDLLKVSGFDTTRLRGSRPKINDADEYEGDEVVELTKEKSSDPWKMVGLDEAAEELKSDEINTMVTTLDDLRLVGVRPRPAFQGRPILNADLKVDLPKELRSDPRVLNEIKKVLLADLGEKGFRIGQDEEGQTQIVSREGELTAGTKDGVVYKLTFGSVFSGTEQEIETGITPDAKDHKKEGAKKTLEEQKKSRYLIVRVNFDETLLGNPPVEPTTPVAPPGVEAPADPKEDADKKNSDDKKEDAPKKEDDKKEGDKKSDDDKPTDSKKNADDPAGSKGEDTVATTKDEKKTEDSKPAAADDKKPEAEKKEAEKKDDKKEDAPADKPKTDAADAKKEDNTKKEDAKPDEPKKDLKAEYMESLKRYDAEKGRFVSERQAYHAKVEAGKQKVKDLNDRFADWYYVISNDSFDKLRLSRAVLIKSKEKPAEKTDTEKTDTEKTDAEKKEGDLPAEKPDAEKKDADKKDKDADKKTDDKPAEKAKEEKTDKPEEKADMPEEKTEKKTEKTEEK